MQFLYGEALKILKNNTICVITSNHNPFDTRIFHKECYSLTKAGYSVVLLAPVDGPEKIVNGITVKGFGKLASRSARILNLFRIAALALRSKAVAYHVHESELLLLLPLLRVARPGARFIYDVHENYADAILSGEKYWVPTRWKTVLAHTFNVVEKFMARFADLVVAASPDIEQNFKHHTTMSVRNFAPTHILNTVAADPQKEKPLDIEFVYTGSLTPERGIIEIIKALEIIPQSAPVTFKVTGWFHDQAFKRQVESQKGFARMRFLGRFDRYEAMVGAVAGARAAMMCFHPDPNLDNAAERSNKLFEYMGLGIPLIISDTPGWSEIITKYNCGITVDPQDPADIAEKMLFMVTNPEKAALMGENGKAAVAAHYCWETEGAALVKAYQKLLGE